jgi:hypothetical protein
VPRAAAGRSCRRAEEGGDSRECGGQDPKAETIRATGSRHLGVWGLIAESDPGLDWKEDNPDDWTLKDTITLLCVSTTVGYIVDALHVGKHTVLVGPLRENTSKPKPALTLNIAGPPHERRVQSGSRVTF